MIARAQALWVLLLVLCNAAWLAFALPRSAVLALAGVSAGALLYAAFMGLQFALMHWHNRADPAPRACAAQLLRAWWAELWVAVRVFCWDQPFRSRAEPDWLPPAPNGRCGVVLVHGFLCNRGLWRPWLALLRARGHAVVAVNLEPVFGSIDAYAPLVEAAVQRVQAATGAPPVLIAHSMGGLATRAWLRARAAAGAPAEACAAHVVTLGTPHRGTWAGRFSQAVNGRQMALDGAWVGALAGAEPAQQAGAFTCWYSNCDNIVFPASTATLPGAENRFLPGVAHVAMARHPEVLQGCLALLDALPVAEAKF